MEKLAVELPEAVNLLALLLIATVGVAGVVVIVGLLIFTLLVIRLFSD